MSAAKPQASGGICSAYAGAHRSWQNQSNAARHRDFGIERVKRNNEMLGLAAYRWRLPIMASENSIDDKNMADGRAYRRLLLGPPAASPA